MTVEVILDGPCAGMTEQEYEEMRQLDERVAGACGWSRIAMPAGKPGMWRAPNSTQLVGRDVDTIGVPFFSLDMNGAHAVLKFVAERWNYRARCKFFERLQERASMDPVTVSMPEYPDCLVSLAVELNKHICHAFVDAYEYEVLRNLDPCEKSKLATEFVDRQIERREFTETDAEGREYKRFNPKPKSAPWVKNVVE
jgi:hypothetical protein